MMSWEILFGVGALVLAGALVYGVWRNQTRNRANDAVTESATREEYDRPETYPEVRGELERRVKPQ